MKKSILFITSLFLCVFYLKSNARQSRTEVIQEKMEDVTVPIPPQAYPRLYVRSADLPDLKKRMNHLHVKKVLATLNKLRKDRTPEEEAKIKDRGFRYYSEMCGVISRVQVQALEYLVYGDEKQARRATTAMLGTLRNVSYGTQGDLSRASGMMLAYGTMVYDWRYDQMKESEKKVYVESFIRIAKTIERGYPPRNNEPIAGHSSEWMILRGMLSVGTAIYDEYPDMYDYVTKMMFKDYLPVRNYTYSGHNYHQGASYVNVHFSNDFFSFWILQRMGAGIVCNPAQQFVLYDFLYRRRPDRRTMPADDTNPIRKDMPSYSLPAMLTSSFYEDSYLAHEHERKPNIECHCLIFDILWRDLDLKARAPDDLPLTRYSESPLGWMIARTVWDESSVVAEMKVSEQFVGNHQHLDGGSFQLYYKGPLVIDAGAYQGSSGSYNSPYSKNFFKRTIVHNSLLVYNPDEKFACRNYGGGGKTESAANGGGQCMLGGHWETCRSPKQLMSKNYTTNKALAHGFGPDVYRPDYFYLKGDITQAHTDKVKEAKRSSVFLNLHSTEVPGTSTVSDKVISSDPQLKKFWLLHNIEEPVIKGDRFIIRRIKNGNMGMLQNQALLPEVGSVQIKKVGGKEKEFWVLGTNYPNDALPNRSDDANERGAWCVEVSPAAPAAENYFLNVIQVADNTRKRMNDMKRIDAGRVVSVQIADRIMTLSKNSLPLSGKIDMKVDRNTSMKFVITDLVLGTWQIRKDGKVYIPTVEVRSDDGTFSFEGTAEHYGFLR